MTELNREYVPDLNRPDHVPGDPGCDSCGTCMGCDGCADSANPVDLARGDCDECGACGGCVADCATLRARGGSAVTAHPSPVGDPTPASPPDTRRTL